MELKNEEIIKIIEKKIENAKENYEIWSKKFVDTMPNSEEERTIVWNKWKWDFKLEELKSLMRDIQKEEGKKKRESN